MYLFRNGNNHHAWIDIIMAIPLIFTAKNYQLLSFERYLQHSILSRNFIFSIFIHDYLRYFNQLSMQLAYISVEIKIHTYLIHATTVA